MRVVDERGGQGKVVSDGPRSTVGRGARGWTEGEERSQYVCRLPLK